MNDREWAAGSGSGWYWESDLCTYVYATEDGALTARTLGAQIACSDSISKPEADFWWMAEATLAGQR